MGNSSSKKKTTHRKGFKMIPDNYQTLEQVQQALRTAGLESSNCKLTFFVHFAFFIVIRNYENRVRFK
jgi:hypothetical protein